MVNGQCHDFLTYASMRITSKTIDTTPFLFFLYAIHFAWGVGEGSVILFSFLDPYRASFSKKCGTLLGFAQKLQQKTGVLPPVANFTFLKNIIF